MEFVTTESAMNFWMCNTYYIHYDIMKYNGMVVISTYEKGDILWIIRLSSR
jgi:hypothetical protein